MDTSSIFHHLPFRPKKTRRLFLPGRFSAQHKGRGLEFYSLRDYIPGDTPSKIHWKHTAKTGEILVREEINESNLRVWTLWDISSSMNFGSKQDACEAFHLFLTHLARSGDNALGFLIFSDTIHYAKKPLIGSSPLEMMKRVKKLQANGQEKRGTRLRAALQFTERYARKGDVVFIVSDFFSEESLEEPFGMLALGQECIAVVIRDPHERAVPNTARVARQDLESGIPLSAFRAVDLAAHDECLENMWKHLGIDFIWLEAKDSSEALRIIAMWLFQRNYT